MNDAFDEVVEPFDESGSPLCQQVHESRRLLHAQSRNGVDVMDIAMHAWTHLTPEQQLEAIPELAWSFVMRIRYEEFVRSTPLEVADPDVESCLDDGDEDEAWDAVHGCVEPADGMDALSIVPRQLLIRMLDELIRLRGRVAQSVADAEPTAAEGGVR